MRTASLAIAATLAAAALTAHPAAAQSSIDINLGASIFDDPDATALTGRIGARFTPVFGAEGEANIDVGGDDLDTSLGVFGTGTVPVGSAFQILGRVGYATADGPGDDDGGIALGAGGIYMMDSRNGIRFDFTRYDFGGDADALSLTWVRKFN